MISSTSRGITNLLLMQNLIESNIDSAIGSLFELIALARINEYMDAGHLVTRLGVTGPGSPRAIPHQRCPKMP